MLRLPRNSNLAKPLRCRANGPGAERDPSMLRARSETAPTRRRGQASPTASVQFPSRGHSASEQVCASKETEAKEETATPKTIGSLKLDRWILDKKNKQLIRVRITPRKALFTPTGTKECPVNPDNISRERTTEIIDASEGGDPDILEDNWRLTSQANKLLINLWTGKTIFTFGADSLKDKESGSGSAADRITDKKGQSTIEPDPATPSKEEPTSLPLALGRIHQPLSKPEELKKLHLQHHHMTTDQFRFRTRALHLPKSIYDLFDKIRSECEVCQAAKHAPSRSKTSNPFPLLINTPPPPLL